MDDYSPLPLSLRQIQYLLAVADLGGFRRAADACHVAQPSLSSQVALAERALGVQIFERSGRAARVSPAGVVVLDRARRVVMAARDLAEAARAESNPFHGRIRIGVIPTVCPYLLPEVTPLLTKRCPDLTVVWSEDRTARLVAAVKNGTLDAAIAARESDLGGLECAEIRRDDFVLATGARHPLAESRAPLRVAELKGARVLLLEDGHCLGDQAAAICDRAAGRDGRAEGGYRATSMATLVQMVSRGTDITLLPAMAVPVENRRGQLQIRAFAKPVPGRTIVLAWRRGAAAATVCRAIAEALQTSKNAPNRRT